MFCWLEDNVRMLLAVLTLLVVATKFQCKIGVTMIFKLSLNEED